MNRLFSLTDRSVANEKPDLLVWPETAIPYYILMSGPEGEFKGKLFKKLITGILHYSQDSAMWIFTMTAQNESHSPSLKKKPDFIYDPFNSAMIIQPALPILRFTER